MNPVELLSRAHRPLLPAFQCNVPELATYLQRWALPHQERDLLGRTWLAVDRALDPPRISGYFTLSATSLDRGLITSGTLDRLPRFPIPAVLLARLAVDTRVQGQGMGTWLFDHALRKTLTLATEGPIGFRALVTDAKDERAATFYERQEMLRLTPNQWPCRMVLDLRAHLAP